MRNCSSSFIDYKHRALVFAVACSFVSSPVLANPSGATVVSGSAAISSSGNTLTVTNTPNAIVNWHSFSIGAGETTQFIQQSATSAILNRITGGDPSLILGTLQSNGRVFLINPAGIVFGAGSVVDVAGLVASTLNITDEDFLSGRHFYNANIASPGNVSNAGQITTPNGGFVYLIGTKVENSGVINTPSGEAILAAGHSVEIVDSTDLNQRVLVKAESQDINLSQLMLENDGNIFGVLNSGHISANTVTQDATGKIYFKSAGNIETTSASLVEAKGSETLDGGHIQGFAYLNGHYGGHFDASGRNGGFLETSAAYLSFGDMFSLNLRALDPNGIGGLWLLDPFDFTIGTTEATSISAQLNSGVSVTIDTTNSSYTVNGDTYNGGAGAGDITVAADILLTANVESTLTLLADNNITINAGVDIAAAPDTNDPILNVNLYANGDILMALGSSIDTSGGDILIADKSGAGYANSFTLDQAYLDASSPGTRTGNISIFAGDITMTGDGLDFPDISGGHLSFAATNGLTIDDLVAIAYIDADTGTLNMSGTTIDIDNLSTEYTFNTGMGTITYASGDISIIASGLGSSISIIDSVLNSENDIIVQSSFQNSISDSNLNAGNDVKITSLNDFATVFVSDIQASRDVVISGGLRAETIDSSIIAGRDLFLFSSMGNIFVDFTSAGSFSVGRDFYVTATNSTFGAFNLIGDGTTSVDIVVNGFDDPSTPTATESSGAININTSTASLSNNANIGVNALDGDINNIETAGSLALEATSTILAEGPITIASGSIDLDTVSYIESLEGAITVTSDSIVLNDDSYISSDGDLVLNAASSATSSITLTSGSRLESFGGDTRIGQSTAFTTIILDADSFITSSEELRLATTGLLNLTDSMIEAYGSSSNSILSVGALSLDNSLIKAYPSATLSLNVSGDATLSNDSTLEAFGTLGLSIGGAFLVTGANIITTGNVSATSGSVNLTNSPFNVDGNLTWNIGGGLTLTDAEIIAGGNMNLTTSGALNLASSFLDSDGNMTLNVGSITMTNSSIGDYYVHSPGVVPPILRINSQDNIVLNNGSDIVADNELYITTLGKISLNSGGSTFAESHISTVSPTTIFLFFPSLFSGGYVLDGVEGGAFFSSFNPFTGFFVGSSLDILAILNQNLFITYGTVPGSLVTGIVGQNTTDTFATNPYLDSYGDNQTGPGDSSLTIDISGSSGDDDGFGRVRECS